MELSEQVAAIIKRRMNLPESLDRLIQSYIDEAGYRIMNYLGYSSVRQIPEALQFVWAKVATAAFLSEQGHLEELDDILGNADAVKLGDTSVTPASGSSVVSGFDGAMASVESDLRRYRKMRWR